MSRISKIDNLLDDLLRREKILFQDHLFKTVNNINYNTI